MRRRPAAVVLMLTFLCGLGSVARAQTISGIIAGTVEDAKGKPLPSVSITAKNPSSGRVYPASTNSQGYYRILEVPPGFYEVQADLGGFQTTRHTSVRVSVNRTTIEDFALQIQAKEEVLSQVSRAPMTDSDSATLSTAFPEKQITELPILTRDINSLGLLAPGTISVRTFSFASTLVPFSVNGSRGRDNNFIIDSVDNNEPLFGGAASQFTNTDIFQEYAILTHQLKAEFGRNSGATVNAITKSGSNNLHGTAFWFGQDNRFNAMTAVERAALLKSPARFYENQIGATLGGAIKKDKSFFFISYQWDRARDNLSDVFPVLSTLPTTAGVAALQGLVLTNPLPINAILGLPTVKVIPGLSAPCFHSPAPAGFSTTNPCLTNPSSSVFVNATQIPFNVFRIPNGNLFDVRDHQFSGRFDHRLNNSNDIYARYLFDDLQAPRFPLANAGESAFADLGLYPDWRSLNKQRTQSLLFNHRYYGISSLNELRFSYSRVSQGVGAFGISPSARENSAAATISDQFDSGNPFGNAFPAAGDFITLGRDSKPSKITSNTYEIQDNYSMTRGKHSLKFGANFVRIESNIRSTSGDLGQYIFANSNAPGLQSFLTEPSAASALKTNALIVSQSFTNLISDATGKIIGQGRNALMLREYDAFLFGQDDWRVFKNLTLSLGLRYENFGQPINSIRKFNPAGPKVAKDNNNFAPRIGLAWSPLKNMVVRAGYAIMLNPTVLNIPLLVWQSGPISPLVSTDSFNFSIYQPGGVWPNQPLTIANINVSVGGCSRYADFFNAVPLPGRAFAGTVPLINCSNRETVDAHLRTPYTQNFSLGMQYQLAADWLVEVTAVGNRGTKLFQRIDRNPYAGWDLNCFRALFAVQFAPGQCRNSRLDDTHGDVTELTNGGNSTYYGLQASLTKRLSRVRHVGDLSMTTSYSWSHMLDNTSEIFGPGLRFISSNAQFRRGFGGVSAANLLLDPLSSTPVESITPFAQVFNQTNGAERSNSSFDRRHRFAASFLWEPFPTRGMLLRGWQLNGIVSVQSGQAFTPLNASPFSSCADSNGDGLAGNDRPDIGNPHAALNSVALLVDPACTNVALGYVDLKGIPIIPTTAHFVQRPLQTSAGAGGSATRNSLVGPGIANLDLSLYKNLKLRERYTLQFRWEVYDVFNHPNFGNPIGNAFSAAAQPTPAFAFSATRTAAAISGIIPENALDAQSINGNRRTFLTKETMNTSNRRMQFGIRFIF